MRNYSIIMPQFWTGETGQQLAALGADEVAIAFYLLTCPASNHIGLYHLPPIVVAQHLKWLQKRVEKALAKVCETGFAKYSMEFQQVWVVEMAKYQIGERLSPRDNRIKGVKRTIQWFHTSPLLPAFVERYRDDFHLGDLGIPREAPSGPPLEAKGTKEQRNKGTKEQRSSQGAPSVAVEDLTIPPHLASPESLAALGDWLAYKRERGQAYKKAKYLEDKLADFSNAEDLVASIRNSIGNTWAGLFPAKAGRGSASDPTGNVATARRLMDKIRNGKPLFGEEVAHD